MQTLKFVVASWPFFTFPFTATILPSSPRVLYTTLLFVISDYSSREINSTLQVLSPRLPPHSFYDFSMDIDHLELTSSTHYPVPFRCIFLVGIGIFFWATNLHILYLLGIDTGSTLDIRNPSSGFNEQSSTLSSPPPSRLNSFVHPSTLYRPIYRLGFIYSLVGLIGWLAFSTLTKGDPVLVDKYRHIPFLTAFALLAIIFSPLNHFQKRERYAFLQ